MKVATNFMFTQMSTKVGIKKFGETLMADVVKEYRKIVKGTTEGKPVVTPIVPNALSFEDKMKTLEAVNLIK